MIPTDRGNVAVENLAIGDVVVTASGASRSVVWLGCRRVGISKHPAPWRVWPLRVLAGAFGDGPPRRDLWLSPGHDIASEGALMPILALINGQSVARVKTDEVEYWHVELDAHDILLAHGLPAESHLDCGNRADCANGGAFIEAHPDFKPNHWAKTCLPLVKPGPEVPATKARLMSVVFRKPLARYGAIYGGRAWRAACSRRATHHEAGRDPLAPGVSATNRRWIGPLRLVRAPPSRLSKLGRRAVSMVGL